MTISLLVIGGVNDDSLMFSSPAVFYDKTYNYYKVLDTLVVMSEKGK